MQTEVRHPLQTRYGLTSREIDVLTEVAEGRTNRQIGRELYLAEKTVKVHLQRVYLKMEVTNRTAAAITYWHTMHPERVE
jgi:DNA-binding NarL/FixJ family response regulator